MGYVAIGGLSVYQSLADFVQDELLHGLDITADTFWSGFEAAVNELAPQNRALLALSLIHI